MAVEQFLTTEFDAVRHADVADVSSRPRGADGLHHRLRCANAFEYRVCADAFGQVLDPGHGLITALGHDVRRAEFARELLPGFVTAHRDDAPSAHLLCGQHTKQADGAVADYH